MQTSARPRTLVLTTSDIVTEVAMLGPRGNELGPRQVVPFTTETATLWRGIDELGEFDRITVIGADRGELGARVAQQSQRPLRTMTYGALHWRRRIAGHGVELALALTPRFTSTLYHDGIEVPGIDIGGQLVRKDKRIRDYLAPRVYERKGAATWTKRVARGLDEILAVWNPTTLYLATSDDLPLPADLPASVQVVPARATLADALLVWESESLPVRSYG